MHQILSFKTNKEYLCEPSVFGYESYFDIERELWEEKPIFQTLLDYLNTDFNKMARDKFIDLVALCSNNYKINGASGKFKINICTYDGLDDCNNLIRTDFFCDFLYRLFPNEKKKRRTTSTRRRIKGMTINKEFEKCAIDYLENDLKNTNKDTCFKIELLKNYIDKMNKNKKLREPHIFNLFIAIAREQGDLSGWWLDIGKICNAVPYKENIKEFNNVDDFVNKIESIYSKEYYDEYIIDTREREGDSDVFTIAVSNIYFILQQKWTIKKCANCGKYFVVRNRIDTMYCENPAPLDIKKNCREYAATRGYYANRQSDECENLRTKVKGRLSKRSQRDDFNQENYDKFREYDKVWRKALKNNAEQKQSYFEWLQSVDSITAVNTGNVDTAEPKPPIETEG